MSDTLGPECKGFWHQGANGSGAGVLGLEHLSARALALECAQAFECLGLGTEVLQGEILRLQGIWS